MNYPPPVFIGEEVTEGRHVSEPVRDYPESQTIGTAIWRYGACLCEVCRRLDAHGGEGYGYETVARAGDPVAHGAVAGKYLLGADQIISRRFNRVWNQGFTLGCRLGGAKGHRLIGKGDCTLGSQEPRRFLGAVGLLVVHLRENVHGIAARRAGEGHGAEYD